MNLTAKLHISKNDPVLSTLMDRLPVPEIHSTGDVFNDLMSCIIEQQIHYRSTKKIFQKMMEASDLDRLSLSNFHILEEKSLATYKMAAGKYETILAVIEFFSVNNIDWLSKTEEEVRNILGSIKGIGSWTIDMILLYTLERPNVFPLDDYHLKLIIEKLYPFETCKSQKANMQSIASAWSPFSSTAVLYLLGWKTAQNNLAL